MKLYFAYLIIFGLMEPIVFSKHLPQLNITNPAETMRAFMKAYRCAAIAHFQMCAVVTFAKDAEKDEYYIWKLESLRKDLNKSLEALTRIRAKLDLAEKRAKL